MKGGGVILSTDNEKYYFEVKNNNNELIGYVPIYKSMIEAQSAGSNKTISMDIYLKSSNRLFVYRDTNIEGNIDKSELNNYFTFDSSKQSIRFMSSGTYEIEINCYMDSLYEFQTRFRFFMYLSSNLNEVLQRKGVSYYMGSYTTESWCAFGMTMRKVIKVETPLYISIYAERSNSGAEIDTGSSGYYYPKNYIKVTKIK